MGAPVVGALQPRRVGSHRRGFFTWICNETRGRNPDSGAGPRTAADEGRVCWLDSQSWRPRP